MNGIFQVLVYADGVHLIGLYDIWTIESKVDVISEMLVKLLV